MTMSLPRVSVIVLAYGPEPYLTGCVEAILASTDHAGRPLDLELIVVDNGAPASVAALRDDPRLKFLRPDTNLGFAGGCNLGATASSGECLAFVNSDAIVQPSTLDHLIGTALEPGVGIASGSLRLADRATHMNSAGNPVHYLGLVWAGGLDEPASEHDQSRDITSATGAIFAIRTDLWKQLGGFDTNYFAYHEDTDLSLRTWLRGQRVRYDPDAIALHHYDFSRSPEKVFLVERNRWFTVLTTYPAAVLLRVLPAMLVFEIGLLVLSVAQGWLRAKLRSYVSLLRSAPHIIRRRRDVQRTRTITNAAFANLLVDTLDSPVIGSSSAVKFANAGLRLYWRLVRPR